MSKLPSIICPARVSSQRFPRKVFYEVRGKPIILWTAERIRSEAPEFPLYFAVDSLELAECLKRAGFEAILTDPKHPSGTDRLAEANDTIGAEAVINVQGDEPLVTGAQIRALATSLQNKEAAISTLATPFREQADFNNPNQVKVVCDHAGYALYFSRASIPYDRASGGRPDAQTLAMQRCFRHLGLYAYRSQFLRDFAALKPGLHEQTEKLEQLRALENGYRIHVALTEELGVGIDTPEDIARFEAALPA
ncbi:MAG: 3-deoxy-manno-octulosonate cytidylyltransferase [Opitutia bacterium UBA7350]|nr:MAG: 3-deoxy-manno-octulosonate cytidylyltransferase [Opitutae bacterium UBA7350]